MKMENDTVPYARMWPREIFDQSKPEVRKIEILGKPGVYVLYRDDVPYYVGQAMRLRARLWDHARDPESRYYNFWNYFSVFVAEDEKRRNQIEAILIAAMPTANSAKPKLKREKLPVAIKQLVNKIRCAHIPSYDNKADM
jgi:predicted GIY-YIG superfamily endonuclease